MDRLDLDDARSAYRQHVSRHSAHAGIRLERQCGGDLDRHADRDRRRDRPGGYPPEGGDRVLHVRHVGGELEHSDTAYDQHIHRLSADPCPGKRRQPDRVLARIGGRQHPLWPDDELEINAQIWAADWDGANFGAPYRLAESISTNSYPAAATSSVGDVILWSQDKDGNSSTTEDRQIYAMIRPSGGSWTAPSALTDDGYGKLMPHAALDNSGRPVAVWARVGVEVLDAEGDLTSEDQLWFSVFDGSEWTNPEHAFSAGAIQEPKVIRHSAGNLVVFWVAGSEEFYDIYYSVYDSTHSVWGNPQQLTHNADAEWMISPAAGSGSILAAYVKRRMDFSGESPESTLSDLYLMSQALPVDLSIGLGDLSIEPDPPVRGESASISAFVHFTGPVAIDNVEVDFYDGDPGGAGILIGRGTIPLIVPGSSGTASVSWAVPEGTSVHRIFAVVDPDDNMIEADEGNNTVARQVFDVDLTPYPPVLTGYPSQNWLEIACTVANLGSADAEDIEVKFRLGGLDGPVVYATTLPLLESKTESLITFVWDPLVRRASICCMSSSIPTILSRQRSRTTIPPAGRYRCCRT